MTPLLVSLVLSAAVLHAAWNALAKAGGAPEFSIGAYQTVGSLICLPLLALVPPPPPPAWPPLIASVLLHNLYYFTLSRAYRAGDLSQVYPLVRGLAPVLVAFGAALFVGEWLSPGVLAGIGVISAGLISITLFGRRFGQMPRQALFWGLGTSVLIAAYTVADGLGVRAAGEPLSYIVWLFAAEAWPIALWLLCCRRRVWFAYCAAQPWRVLFGSLASNGAYGLVIYAMSLGALAVVSSLRETSVIFAALLGALWLREPFGRNRVIAAGLVAVGVIALKMFA